MGAVIPPFHRSFLCDSDRDEIRTIKNLTAWLLRQYRALVKLHKSVKTDKTGQTKNCIEVVYIDTSPV